jgi:hypothetical protein
MGDFDDAVRLGLEDAQGNLLVNDDASDKQIIGELSFEDDCTLAESNIRLQLGAQGSCAYAEPPVYYFYLSHDRFYLNDPLALAVYTEQGHRVGYIRKDSENPYFSDKRKIERHCFRNGHLKNLYVKQNFDDMIIVDHGMQVDFTEISDLKRKSDWILYEENNVSPLESEIATIEYALENVQRFGFTSIRIDCLSKRLSAAKLEVKSRQIRKGADKLENAVGNALEVGVNLIGSLFGKK